MLEIIIKSKKRIDCVFRFQSPIYSTLWFMIVFVVFVVGPPGFRAWGSQAPEAGPSKETSQKLILIWDA